MSSLNFKMKKIRRFSYSVRIFYVLFALFGICTMYSTLISLRSDGILDFESIANADYEYSLHKPSTQKRYFNENSEEYNNIRGKAFQLATLETSERLELEEREMEMIDSTKEQYLNELNERKLDMELKETLIKSKQEKDIHVEYYGDGYDYDSTVITISHKNTDLIHYKRFVISLRNTGFKGNIILGIEASASRDVLDFLSSQNVTLKSLIPTECTYESAEPLEKCYLPYTNIKREWSHYPLIRDWLVSCVTCTGPVLILDSVKRAIFQKNPFGVGSFTKLRLHLYEHHRNLDVSQTTDYAVLKSCKGIDLLKRMYVEPTLTKSLEYVTAIIVPFIAAGNRDDIIEYTGAVYSGIRELLQIDDCQLHDWSADVGGAVVNFLRTEGLLPFNTLVVPHRFGEVNNALYDGSLFFDAHQHLWNYRGFSKSEAENTPYEGSDENTWIDTEYLLTNENGEFLNAFYGRSTIITDYASFGMPFLKWLDKKLNITISGSRKISESDDFYLKEGDTNVKSSKEKLKIVLNKGRMTDIDHKSGDRNSQLSAATNKLNDEETNGLYYPPEEATNQTVGDHLTDGGTQSLERENQSNLVPVSISIEDPSYGTVTKNIENPNY